MILTLNNTFPSHFSSRVGVPGKSDGVIFTPVKTEIVSFAPELVGGEELFRKQLFIKQMFPFTCTS